MNLEKETTRNMESSNGQSSADHTNKSSYLNEQNKDENLIYESKEREAHKVEKTPFAVVRDGKEWLTVLGDFVMSKGMSSREEAEEDAQREDWSRIMQVVEATVRTIIKLEKDGK